MAVLRVRCTTEFALPCPNPFVHCDGRLPSGELSTTTKSSNHQMILPIGCIRYVYPSGKLLPMLWGLVKHFLDARTRSKVHEPQPRGALHSTHVVVGLGACGDREIFSAWPFPPTAVRVAR